MSVHVASAGAVSVSVLNASYAPLGSTRLNRAMALVLKGDAVVEQADPRREVRHVGGSFPWPLVIRLLRNVKVYLQTAPIPWSKTGVLRRDGYQCAYRSPVGFMPEYHDPEIILWDEHPATTVDHIVPRARGGRDRWDNTVACCLYHNSKKDDFPLEETNLVLTVTPTAPTRVRVYGGKKSRR